MRLLVRRGVVGALCAEVGAEVGASPAVVVGGNEINEWTHGVI